MDQHQLRVALLKVSVVLVLVSSWMLGGFVLESRPRPGTEVGNSEPGPLNSLVRLPASLPSQLPASLPAVFASGDARMAEPIRMYAVKIGCWERAGRPTIEAGARWVRLIGKTCQSTVLSPAPTASLQITNVTNGYAATVFDGESGQFTTDFIPLERGRNEVRIKLDPEPNVTFESRFIITR